MHAKYYREQVIQNSKIWSCVKNQLFIQLFILDKMNVANYVEFLRMAIENIINKISFGLLRQDMYY